MQAARSGGARGKGKGGTGRSEAGGAGGDAGGTGDEGAGWAGWRLADDEVLGEGWVCVRRGSIG